MNNKTNINLVCEPWIPVVCAGGYAKLASLKEVFAPSEEIIDLSVPPLERISLMRLLLCIAHAATGGVDDDFERARIKVTESADAYLDKWKDRFYLFDEYRPFLQQANIKLPPQKEKGDEKNQLSRIDFYTPLGSYNKFFNSNAEYSNSLGNLALKLLTFQNFVPGGTCGTVLWNNKPTSKTPQGSSSDAVCAAKNALRIYLLKPDLFSSICANLVPRNAIEKGIGVQKMKFGRPCWEVELIDKTTPPESVENNTATFLGRLVPISRAVKIFDGGKYLGLGDGLTYKSFPDVLDFDCAFRTEIKNKKTENLNVLRCDPNKAVWRNLHAILANGKNNNARPPWAITRISGKAAKIWAGGIASNKAKIETSSESVFQIPATENSNVYQMAVQKYGELVADADIACAKLGSVIKSTKLVSGIKQKAEEVFWDKLAWQQAILMELFLTPQRALADENPFADTEHKWASAIVKAQLNAIEIALPAQSARQICAVAEIKKKLFENKKRK